MNNEKKGFPMTRKEFKEWCSEQSKKIIEDFDCYSCYDEGIIPYRDESGYFTCLDCNDVEDTDHNFPCTNSNGPGQKGSIYE